MTEIIIDIKKLSGVEPDDALADLRGRFDIYPYALYYRDDYLLTKQPLRVTVDGIASVYLPPTLAGEGIVFASSSVPGFSSIVVQIPDSPTPVNLVDLVQLDPSTLDPTPDNSAAWDAALADYNDRLTDQETLTWQGI